MVMVGSRGPTRSDLVEGGLEHDNDAGVGAALLLIQRLASQPACWPGESKFSSGQLSIQSSIKGEARSRKHLFSMINDLPTIFEVVTETKPIKDKPTPDSGSKSRGSTKLSHTQTWLAGLVLVILVHSRSLQGK
ncbi:hypothetical protein RJT34_17460 [Clitoria ternatea]|uniref:Uncharacterized protein n=1 Tax=Clitoria ternatea TaxID=43366 RepID=A0AAN9JAL9_CLITE